MSFSSIVFDRVVALGGISAGAELGDATYQRGDLVVTMAGEQVLGYIGKLEADIPGLTAVQQGIVYTVTAECAAAVMARNSTSSPAGYEMDGPFGSVLLTDAQKAALDRLFPTATAGSSRSIVIERAPESTYITPNYWSDPFYIEGMYP